MPRGAELWTSLWGLLHNDRGGKMESGKKIGSLENLEPWSLRARPKCVDVPVIPAGLNPGGLQCDEMGSPDVTAWLDQR